MRLSCRGGACAALDRKTSVPPPRLIMAAADYGSPADSTGLRSKRFLAPLAHPKAVGMEITIFSPTLDRDGKGLRAFLDMLSRGAKNFGGMSK